MFTFSLLGLSLRSLMRHLSHFPFALQKNQGASGLLLMVWMIPRVWDRILHVTGNRITSLINASRSFVWLSFYLSPGCFAATVLSQKNWAMCSAVPMIIQVILGILDTAMSWSMGEKRSWQLGETPPSSSSSCCTIHLKAGKRGGKSLLPSQRKVVCRSRLPAQRSRWAREAPAGVPGSWVWGVKGGEGRRGHPGTKRWEAEHA